MCGYGIWNALDNASVSRNLIENMRLQQKKLVIKHMNPFKLISSSPRKLLAIGKI